MRRDGGGNTWGGGSDLREVKGLEGDSLGTEAERGGSLIWILGCVFSELEPFRVLGLCLDDMDLGSKLRMDDVDMLPRNPLSLLAVIDFMLLVVVFLFFFFFSEERERERESSVSVRDRERGWFKWGGEREEGGGFSWQAWWPLEALRIWIFCVFKLNF